MSDAELERRMAKWKGECLRKKRMKEEHANAVINRAKKKDGTELRAYLCPHCSGWHVTKWAQDMKWDW